MEDQFKLIRFVDAQSQTYHKALSEIKEGRKQSHWMWFIFPQAKGLGTSDVSNYYGIRNLEEAGHYLKHPVLKYRLIEITKALIELKNRGVNEIFPEPDNLKLHSSMTLFSLVENTQPIFREVLDKYFEGKPDQRTFQVLGLHE